LKCTLLYLRGNAQAAVAARMQILFFCTLIVQKSLFFNLDLHSFWTSAVGNPGSLSLCQWNHLIFSQEDIYTEMIFSFHLDGINGEIKKKKRNAITIKR